MESAEIIALVAVAVTGISVLTNYLLSKQRLVHDEAMQDKRLAHEKGLQESRLEHERAEAVRTTAATAYSKADLVVRQINLSTIQTFERGPRKNMHAARDTLSFVIALGWSGPVRDGAARLLESIANLGAAAVETARATGENREKLGRRFEQCRAEATEALEAYRKAVAEES